MVEKLEGKVEAIGRKYGISLKIGSRWIKVDANAAKFVDDSLKGAEVELTIENGIATFIKRKESSIPSPPQNPEPKVLSEEDMKKLEAEYVEYQTKIMNECLQAVEKLQGSKSEMMKAFLASAMFTARCKPFYYFILEKQ